MRINSFDPFFFCDQIMSWSFVLYGRDWLLHRFINEIIDFINLRINIHCSNQSRPKNSKLQNIIWSEKKIWIKTIDSRQRTTETIDFIDLRINIICSNQSRPKNSKLQNFIWSQEKIWIKKIVSRQQTVQNKSSTNPDNPTLRRFF